MKTLLLMRHAKSSWSDPSLPDHDRPLNKRGQRDAPRMGALLRELAQLPDLILSSTAVRARSTVALVVEASGCVVPVTLSEALYPGHPDAVRSVLRALGDGPRRVMVVSHNPGLEQLLSALTGAEEALPTAALAAVDLPIERWSDLDARTRGAVVGVWRARDL